jgi:hypothetical protein
MSSTQMLWLAERFRWALPADRPTVTLDLFLPHSKVPAFFDWYYRELDFFPLWCVPYRRVRNYLHKLMEDELVRVGGIKTLIAHNYYSEAEFWRIWNKRNYDQVKALTDPRNLFRDLYTKMCRAARGLS